MLEKASAEGKKSMGVMFLIPALKSTGYVCTSIPSFKNNLEALGI
jgi:hypothetical protein